MADTLAKQYSVRAVHCDHRAATKRSTRRSSGRQRRWTRSWDRLRKAKTIAIKFNQDWPTPQLVMWSKASASNW